MTTQNTPAGAGQSAHTPIPWKFHVKHDNDVGDVWYIESTAPDCCGIIAEGQNNAQDAEYICRAVNSHAALVAALRGCAAALVEAGKDFATSNRLAARPNLYELHVEAARAALAQVEGGK